MFDRYFDGGNLDEVLSGMRGMAEMVFSGVDAADRGLAELLADMNLTQYKLTSFDTAERAAEFAAHSDIGEHDYELYAPYITSSVESPNKDGAASGISYELKSYDDFQ